MNNDLISREALKKHILEIFEEEEKHDKKWAMGLKYSIKIIDKAPTVELTYISDIPDDKVKDLQELAIDYSEGIAVFERKRPQGEWVITAEDSDGIHRIQCPFCRYEKGSDFIDYIIVTFEKFPPFCENCGAALRGTINDT